MASVNEILKETKNRQYPMPAKNWKYYQEWYYTLFFHWEVPVHLLEKYIPKGIEIDTYSNMAWVTLVSFEVKNMHFRGFLPFPYISDFEEINIRTYVIKNGIRGIYLFSIETNKLAEVILTNIFIGLPYQKSKIKRHGNCPFSKNKKLNTLLDVKIGKSALIKKKTDLDLWLTERHSLYEVCNNKMCRFDIHHKEWELQNLDVTINDINYDVGKYKFNSYPDKIHYAEKTEVVLWGKKKV